MSHFSVLDTFTTLQSDMSANMTTLSTMASTAVPTEAPAATLPPYEPSLYTKEWAHNVELVFLFVVVAIGVPGNLLLIIVQAKCRKKTSTDYLLMIMAIYELVCCSYNAPMKLVKKVPYIHNNLLGTTFRCRFNLFFLNFTSLGAAQMLAAIAVDRYLKMCWPLNTFYGEKQAFVISVVIVFTSFALSLPHVVFIDWNDAIEGCLMIMDRFISPATYGRYLNIVFFMVFFILVFSYTNIHISMKMRYRKKKLARPQKSGRLDSSGVTGNSSDEPSLSGTKITNEGYSNTNDNVSHGPKVDVGSGNDNGAATKGISRAQCHEAEQGSGDYTKEGRNGKVTIQKHAVEVSTIKLEEKSASASMGNTDATINGQVKGDEGELPSSMVKYSSTGDHQKRSTTTRISARENTENRTLIRLTVTMALISLIYIITGFVNWLTFLLGPLVIDFSWVHLSFSLPLINCITNPVLLFTMSERFKNAARKIVCGR